MIDLHIHSTASDGSFTPAEIIEAALADGIDAIAITDHDTIDGVKDVTEAGIPHDLEFITGIELSAQPLPGLPGNGSIHILGYGFSIYDRALNQTLTTLKQARADRNPRIIQKLNDLGFSLTQEEVVSLCSPGQTGRPHIAQAMVEKGYVENFNQAFDLYLAKDRPAYVDKYRISCKEAIQLILDAGGIPVLAHPGILGDHKTEPVAQLVERLCDLGLQGIEVFYTDHSRSQTEYFKHLAEKLNLFPTGGSDFHGTMKQGVQMGIGDGNLHVELDLFKTLTREIAARRKKNPDLDRLETNLLHTFKKPALLDQALRHSSYVNEMQNPAITDNQRMEFLGDAVLGLAISTTLMNKYPCMSEGELSKLRAALVSETSLAAMAREMDLGRFIKLGKGERLSRGDEKHSILADTFEAVLAAVFLDAGFDHAHGLIQTYFKSRITTAILPSETEDYKSLLQELVQETGHTPPSYILSGESGPDHDKIFEMTVHAHGTASRGIGKSKKAAEQDAAHNALKLLNHPLQ